MARVAFGPLLCGLITILLGVSVLIGWALSIPVLQSLIPGFVSMKPNTAISFILMGAALILMGQSPVPIIRRNVAWVCTLLVLLMCAAILGETLFSWQSGVDEWLFTDPMDTFRTAAPGRMALPSILAFTFAGLAIFLLDWKPRPFFRPSEWLAVLSFYLGVISSLAHALTTVAFDGYFGFTPMALHTALGFMVLCAGILLARPQSGCVGYLRASGINPVERRIYVTLATSAVLLVTAGFATLFSSYDSVARSELVNQTYQVRGALLNTLSTIQDVETGGRGYLLTGDKLFLAPYEKALNGVESSLTSLALLVADNPAQVAHLPRLEELVRSKIKHTRNNVESRSTTDLGTASARVSTRKGMELMVAIRGVLNVMDAEEARLLAVRQREERESTTRLGIAISVGGILSLGMLLFSAAAIRRGILQEKLSREELRNSEENLVTTLRSIGDGVMTTDTQSRVTGLNPVAEALTGWPESDALGKPVGEIFQIINEDSRQPVEIPVYKVLATGRIQGLANHTVLIARDGTECPIADSAAPLYDANRELRGVVLVFRDVTAERAAELERERVFSLSRDLLCIAHEDGYFRRVNPAFTETLGWSNEELLARPYIEFVHPDDRKITGHTLEKHFVQDQQVVETENRYLHKDGSWRVISWKSVLQPGGYVYATARDVTATKVTEVALQQARADADAANQAKSSFLATMSHEIRTPMNGVIGTVDVLRQTSLHPYQKELVEIIRESAYALLSVIDGILDYSKIEAGKMELECAPMSLSQLLEAVCDALNPVAVRKQVDLTYFTDPRLPDMIESDAVRLRQVLNNLIGNAIKFSAGQQRVGLVRVRVEPEGENSARITVTDNGVGMEAELLSKLFHPFTQADSSTTRTFGGTGLGLSICKRLVELLDGEIYLESTIGKGTTFTVIIPVAASAVRAEQLIHFSLKGIHCFIVIQNDEIAADLSAYLEHAGAHVKRAGEYEQAARSIIEHAAPGSAVVISEASQPINFTAIRVPFSACPGGVRHVLLMRGYHRRPYQETVDIVTVDGDAMRRKTFLHAVAIAAGRAAPIAEEIRETHADQVTLPSREEALAQGRLILVAEDNEINQKVIRHQLALLGFVCEIVGNGVEALHCWRTGKYGLILSDLHMPGLDGQELTEKIRSEEGPGQRTPIIAFTANITKGERERCHKAGMDDYLAKPAQLGAFKAIVEKWLFVARHPNPSASYGATSPTVSHAGPVLDPNALAQYVGDDPALISEFLRDYLESALTASDEINSAAAISDWVTVGAVGHRLKSSSRAVGALPLGECCEGLELAAEKGDERAMKDLLAEFQSHLKIVVGSIRQLLGD